LIIFYRVSGGDGLGIGHQALAIKKRLEARSVIQSIKMGTTSRAQKYKAAGKSEANVL